jgi:hypothetical protein
MLDSTLEIIRSVIKADKTVTPLKRSEYLALLKNGDKAPKPKKEVPAQPRLVRRSEAGRILGRSVRTIDLLVGQGLLVKTKWKGRKRAAGITSASLEALLASEGK